MPKKRTIEPVHLVFRHHSLPKEPYLARRLLRGMKTHVYEEATGALEPVSRLRLSRVVSEYQIADLIGFSPQSPAHHPFAKSMNTFLFEVLKRGKEILPGELAKNEAEKQKLELFEKQWYESLNEALRNRNLPAIKNYFRIQTDFVNERHQMIIRTIQAAKKPLVGRFGIAHSTLSRELQQQNISSTREMHSQVFTPQDQVIRKLLSGKKPTDNDYKKGFIDIVWWRHEGEMQSDTQVRFLALVHSTLLNRLNETQLNELVLTGWIPSIFIWNGLPPKPSERQLRTFLQKHSEFYRREQAIRKMKRKTTA